MIKFRSPTRRERETNRPILVDEAWLRLGGGERAGFLAGPASSPRLAVFGEGIGRQKAQERVGRHQPEKCAMSI